MSEIEANKCFKKFIQAQDSIPEILQLFEDLKKLSEIKNEDGPQKSFSQKNSQN
jgi:hypothetical protein